MVFSSKKIVADDMPHIQDVTENIIFTVYIQE